VIGLLIRTIYNEKVKICHISSALLNKCSDLVSSQAEMKNWNILSPFPLISSFSLSPVFLFLLRLYLLLPHLAPANSSSQEVAEEPIWSKYLFLGSKCQDVGSGLWDTKQLPFSISRGSSNSTITAIMTLLAIFRSEPRVSPTLANLVCRGGAISSLLTVNFQKTSAHRIVCLYIYSYFFSVSDFLPLPLNEYRCWWN
jgi:hypothetical protein